jgi:glycosyltransferase involved in cell wall biosynthesis
MSTSDTIRAPRVAIVVPSYNYARYLGQSLGSIAAQTRAPDQVLIIDDASNDDSVAVTSRFLADNLTWRLIRHQENRGVTHRQNEALAAVDTDWVSFLGADDVLHPSYVEKMIAQAARFPSADLICGCCEIIDGASSRSLRPILLPAQKSTMLTPADVRDLLRVGDNYFLGTVSLYRRSAVQALGGFDESLGSFSDAFLARQLALGSGFYFLAEILGYWRIHGENYSTITATSPDAVSGGIEKLRSVIVKSSLFPSGYDDLFERRTRFNAARLALIQDSTLSAKAERTAALLNAGRAERYWIQLLLIFGTPGRLMSLAWVTLRTHPMSLLRMLTQIGTRRAISAIETSRRRA